MNCEMTTNKGGDGRPPWAPQNYIQVHEFADYIRTPAYLFLSLAAWLPATNIGAFFRIRTGTFPLEPPPPFSPYQGLFWEFSSFLQRVQVAGFQSNRWDTLKQHEAFTGWHWKHDQGCTQGMGLFWFPRPQQVLSPHSPWKWRAPLTKTWVHPWNKIRSEHIFSVKLVSPLLSKILFSKIPNAAIDQFKIWKKK